MYTKDEEDEFPLFRKGSYQVWRNQQDDFKN